MLSPLRRYWPVIPIAAVFAAGVFFEWSNANGPRPHTYAAAPQSPAFAATQPPVPSAAKIAQPQQQYSTAKSDIGGINHNSAVADNGVAKPDLISSPKISVKTDDGTDSNKDKSSSDWWLVIFTGGLLLTAIITFFTLRRQAVAMEGTLNQMTKDSETRAREAERQLQISEAAIKNAETQVNTAFQQTDLALKEHGLARLQFFAANRPKLEIRFVQRVRANPDVPSQRIYVEFSVINTGTSAATITGSRVRLDWFDLDDVPNPDAMGGIDIIPHHRMIASARQRCSLDAAPENSFEAGFSELPDSRLVQAKLLVLGWVVYEDDRGSEFGDTRTTYFCRAYDSTTQRFAAIPELAVWEFTH